MKNLLTRYSDITSCSRWAEERRVAGGDFSGHSEASSNVSIVSMKAAQVGLRDCNSIFRIKESVVLNNLLTRYSDILHRSGVGSRRAERFKQTHLDEVVFLRRARALDAVFRLKDSGA